MACPALLADIRSIVGAAPPLSMPRPAWLALWVAVFAGMLSLVTSLRLRAPGISTLAEWLRVAAEASVQTLGAYHNRDALLSHKLGGRVTSSTPCPFAGVQASLSSLQMPAAHEIVQASDESGLLP